MTYYYQLHCTISVALTLALWLYFEHIISPSKKKIYFFKSCIYAFGHYQHVPELVQSNLEVHEVQN